MDRTRDHLRSRSELFADESGIRRRIDRAIAAGQADKAARLTAELVQRVTRRRRGQEQDRG